MCDLSRVLYVVPKLGMGQVKPRYNYISLPQIGDKSHQKRLLRLDTNYLKKYFFLKFYFYNYT